MQGQWFFNLLEAEINLSEHEIEPSELHFMVFQLNPLSFIGSVDSNQS